MEKISSTAAIPSGGGAQGDKGDDQGSRSGSLGFGARRFEDEISKRRVHRYIYPPLSVVPILCFRCHRVPQLSVDWETRCNRAYEIGSTEIENQINPRHSVRPRFWVGSTEMHLGGFNGQSFVDTELRVLLTQRDRKVLVQIL